MCKGKYNVLHFIFSVLEATKVNNDKVIELLVAVPGSVSQRELDFSLVTAVKNKFFKCAEALLKGGADVEAGVSFSSFFFSFFFWGGGGFFG